MSNRVEYRVERIKIFPPITKEEYSCEVEPRTHMFNSTEFVSGVTVRIYRKKRR